MNLKDSFITLVWLVPIFNFGIWKLESDVFDEDEEAAFSFDSSSNSFSGSITGSTCFRRYSIITLNWFFTAFWKLLELPQSLVEQLLLAAMWGVCWVATEVRWVFWVSPNMQAVVLKSSRQEASLRVYLQAGYLAAVLSAHCCARPARRDSEGRRRCSREGKSSSCSSNGPALKSAETKSGISSSGNSQGSVLSRSF